VVVVMMMVMMVVMVMVRRRSRSGVLREGVTREADGENGRGDKALDHGRTFLWLGNPNGSPRTIGLAA
jgi:hypothetical protein